MDNLEQQLSRTEGRRPSGRSSAASFLLCNSYYWCASSIAEFTDDLHCPSCGSVVESIPLETGELLSFGVDAKRGVILEFKKALRNVA